MLKRIVSLHIVLICILGSLSLANATEEQGVSRVILLPFDTSAAGKFKSLEPGLKNMLISRLSAKDRIDIIDYALKKGEITKLKRTVKKGESTKIFTELNTDYIVSGALFAVDKGLQVQVVFHPKDTEKNAVDLTIFAEDENRIIMAMDQLSEKIAEKVFGYESAKKNSEVSGSFAGAEGFKTEHPDRAYKKGAYLGDTLEGGGRVFLSKGIRKSLKIPMNIVSMAMGDVDGDGQEEIVLAANGELKIFQFINGVFKKIDGFSIGVNIKVNAINLADVNRDGQPEIYISANNGYLASSMILEWSKVKGGAILISNIPWYIRPLNLPGEGMTILGQNVGLNKSKSVEPGIYKLVVSKNGKKLVQRDPLQIPQTVNLFDFALADLDGDGKIEKVVLGASEKLLVYDHENRIKWVSDQDFGGSKNHFGPYLSDEDDSGLFNSLGQVESDDRILTFIPTRVIVTDANGDGTQDIVVGSNKLTTYRFFENLRSYDGGVITCLSWNGEKMTELWKTNTINGYIADYSFTVQPTQIEPEDGKGASEKKLKGLRNRLIVGQIPDRGVYDYLTFSGQGSHLLAYEMDIELKDGGK